MANDAEVQLAVDQAMKDQKKQKRKKKLIVFGVILAVIVVIAVVANRPNVYMENNQDLKKFKVGDTVTIEGVCDDTDLFGDVDVKKCVIADQFATVPDYDGAQKVKINDFVKRYKENQVKADEKYKGKTVQFTAKVTHVADEYAVVEPFNADVWDWDCDVQICFEDMDDLKKVTEGKMVTIVGECYGQTDMYTAKICRAIVKK